MCEKSCKIYARTSKCHKTFPSIWLVETIDRVSVIFVLFFLSFLTSFFGFTCFLEKGSNDRQYIYNIFACILCCCCVYFFCIDMFFPELQTIALNDILRTDIKNRDQINICRCVFFSLLFSSVLFFFLTEGFNIDFTVLL